jgi:hypothetical protein
VHARPLLRDYFGEPAYEEAAIVLEIKLVGELPSWLAELMSRTRAERFAYSKFITASEAVHGALQPKLQKAASSPPPAPGITRSGS